MKEKRKANVVVRSLGITLFIGAVCMFIMAEASYLISSHQVGGISKDYYQLVTEENSVQVTSWYTEQVAVLESHVFALEQNGVDDRASVKQYLVDLLDQSEQEYVYDVYFMYPDNVMLCGTDFDNVTEHPEINYNERPWYQNAIITDSPVVSTAYLDTDTHEIVVTISKRVKIGGEIAGTLCMDMFITSLRDLINGPMMPDNSYGFLVDSEFKTIFHPCEKFDYEDEPPLLNSCGVENYDSLVSYLDKNQYGMSFTDYDGTQRTFYFEELSDTGWFVISAIDSNLIDAEAAVLRKNLFITAGIILLISIVIETIVKIITTNKAISTERALERLKVEEEQRAYLEEAKNKAEAANRSKTSFLFNMSHDIRTPMNAIVGFTNMAIKNIDDREKVLESLQKTQKSSELLLTLINDILEMSRIESGKRELLLEDADMNNAFIQIDSIMNELATAKQITLSFEINIKDRYIKIDKTRFNRILLNLGTNAIKYTQNGGWVKVAVKQLDKKENSIGYFELTIEDNGMGMSDEFQKHMFEEFTRETSSTKSGIQGTGLGLSVTKAFADIMGATISCESKINEGTKFIVVFPLEIISSEDFKKDEDNINTVNVLNFKNKRVLLVEDNDLNREIASDILTNEIGLVVETAEDGTVAVDLLKKMGPDFFDLILMDIQMPYMNGYDATKAIREMYPNKHIPIIALSANAFSEDKQKSIDSGMDDHVEKPIKVEQLIQAIGKLL